MAKVKAEAVKEPVRLPVAKPLRASAPRERTYWKGTLAFGPLLQIPVELMKGAREPTKVALNTHHGGACEKGSGAIGGRIRREPRVITPETEPYVDFAGWCEACGSTVRKDDTVKGYEGRLVDEAVIDSLPVGSVRQITLDRVVEASEIDARYFEEPYWIDVGAGGEAAYALLRKVLDDLGKVAVGKVTLRIGTREELVVVRPVDGALLMHVMRWPGDVRDVPRSTLDKLADAAAASPAMVKMAKELVAALEKPWDPAEYEDEYSKVLGAYYEALVRGEAVAPTAESRRPEAAPIDLMEALRRSLDVAKKGAA